MFATTHHRRQRGSVLVLTLLLLVIVMGGVGLAIDAGHLQWSKTKQQTAADMAALAAGLELTRGASDIDIERAARTAAKRNGYHEIQVTRPQPTIVSVTVSQRVPTFFMRLFRVNDVAMAARSVASAGEQGGLRLAE